MKLLRNPWIVGALVVAAAALLLNSTWPSLRRMYGGGRTNKVPAALTAVPAATPAPARPAQPSAGTPAASVTASNRKGAGPLVRESASALDGLESAAHRWIAESSRDPFQLRPVVAAGGSAPAAQTLTITAVWRQTGSSLAVVNDRVVSEGDTILDFRIVRIDAEGVWVDGPNGREQLPFRSGTSVTAARSENAAVAENSGNGK